VPQERPAYRPDIEGLRGIAILLVVAFHAGVSAFRGGFVGVDVFFVLSGFFITALLVRELAETGDVDVNAFYTRRALRLLPALLVALLVTLGAVFWLYAPIDRAWIAGDARAVSLYAGNINFARGAVDFFSTGDHPLLHTWSSRWRSSSPRLAAAFPQRGQFGLTSRV
jgi:peptidoglycan/LPS O-acetylase OafA/YrhL